jgi:tetratricopeptide (TPR) repeat protein
LPTLARPALVLALLLALPLGAQSLGSEPPRPPLPSGGDPNDWESYFDAGVKLFMQDATRAGAHFDWAARLDPSRAEPYFARWANFRYRTNTEDVSAYLRRVPAVRARPEMLQADSLRDRAFMRNPFVHRGLEILVYDRLPGNFSESRDTCAWIAYSNGSFDAAAAHYTRTVERGGDAGLWARYDRSLSNVAAGKMPAALADLKALLEGLRARDEAELVYHYVPKQHILYMIGLIQNQLGDHAAARASFGESIVEDASVAYGYMGLAALSRAARQHARAADAFAQAIELAPEDGHLRYLHAQALFDLQRYTGAHEELLRVIALEPHCAAPHYLLGRVAERSGKEVEAYPHYERFVAQASAKDPVAVRMRQRLALRARAPARVGGPARAGLLPLHAHDPVRGGAAVARRMPSIHPK